MLCPLFFTQMVSNNIQWQHGFQVHTLGVGLSISSCHRNHTLVNLYANHYALLLDKPSSRSIVVLLVDGLVEEYDTTNAELHTVICSEKQLPVLPPVLLSVLDINALKALGNTAWWRERARGTVI